MSGQPDAATNGTIRHLGHAGFLVEQAGTGILMDPWLHAAFLHAWFPLPDNRAQSAQRAGAMSYPNCDDLPPDAMRAPRCLRPQRHAAAARRGGGTRGARVARSRAFRAPLLTSEEPAC